MEPGELLGNHVLKFNIKLMGIFKMLLGHPKQPQADHARHTHIYRLFPLLVCLPPAVRLVRIDARARIGSARIGRTGRKQQQQQISRQRSPGRRMNGAKRASFSHSGFHPSSALQPETCPKMMLKAALLLGVLVGVSQGEPDARNFASGAW